MRASLLQRRNSSGRSHSRCDRAASTPLRHALLSESSPLHALSSCRGCGKKWQAKGTKQAQHGSRSLLYQQMLIGCTWLTQEHRLQAQHACMHPHITIGISAVSLLSHTMGMAWHGMSILSMCWMWASSASMQFCSQLWSSHSEQAGHVMSICPRAATDISAKPRIRHVQASASPFSTSSCSLFCSNHCPYQELIPWPALCTCAAQVVHVFKMSATRNPN